jgi:hypothetical protein
MAKGRGITLFIIFLILGGLIGSISGEIIARSLPEIGHLGALDHPWKIGLIQPLHLNLEILSVTFGLIIKVNALTIIGIIGSVILYYRLKK